MKLSSLIQEKQILLNDERISNDKELFEKASQMAADQFKLNKDEVYSSFIKRYEMGHDIFEGTFAIPHGRLENFNDLIIIVIKTKKTINFAKGEADFFFFLMTSNTGSNVYLKALAGIVKIIKENKDKLKNLISPEELLNVINNSNIKLEESLTVAEIMSKDVFTAKAEQTVSQILDIMKVKNIKYMPVVNDKEEYIGKIDLLDILGIAYPSYLFLMNNLSFLSNLRSFEDFIAKENKVLIKDVYIAGHKRVIRSDASVVELGFVMKKEHMHYITVVDEKEKVIGIVSMRDMLNKIIRA